MKNDLKDALTTFQNIARRLLRGSVREPPTWTPSLGGTPTGRVSPSPGSSSYGSSYGLHKTARRVAVERSPIEFVFDLHTASLCIIFLHFNEATWPRESLE